MDFIYPNYYKDFACIKGACRHSCCIGWEIDIDEDTLAYYDTLEGAIGERVRGAIDRDVPCFRLGADERCPFLNGDGLCDLILALGENGLCEICAEHPRFYNAFRDRTECGLGLACEAAARRILLSEAPFALRTAEGNYPTPTEEILLLRDEVIRVLQNRDLTLDERIEAARVLCKTPTPDVSAAEWAKRFLLLERLDDAWTEHLLRLSEREAHTPDEEFLAWERQSPVCTQFLVYLVYRHLSQAEDEADAAETFGFIEASFRLFRALLMTCPCGTSDGECATEIARLFSSEIEYSDENVDAIKAYFRA